MTSLKSFFNIAALLLDTEKSLGLESLTESDRIILIEFWQLSNQGEALFSITYEQFIEKSQHPISKAQFYKTITKAKELNLISHVGTARSHTYRWEQ